MGNLMSVIHREVMCVNTLQTNDWLILNSIIYEIYTTADFDGDETEVFGADENACRF